MVKLDDRLTVRMSFHRASKAGEVLSRFYELFLDSDPEVGRRFADTNFERQRELLEISLNTAVLSATDDRYSRRELERIKKSHGPGELDIPAHLYGRWRDSLIQAISEMDPEFDDTIEATWRAVLQPAVDFLASKP